MIPAATDRQAGLDALFRPRGLAVVGATERPGSVGRAVMENLIQGGFRGGLFPVHPKSGSILGLRAYRRLAEAPGPVDAAVIIVPPDAVEDVVVECAAAGVRAAAVITAGFRECGPEGARREAGLRAAAEAGGVTLLGPNCLGYLNTAAGLNATFARRLPKAGAISFLSQSGALGVYALEFAAVNGIGLRLFASLGNKAVADENDLLSAFGRDEGTRVILAYLEDFREPGAFLERAAAVASGPVPKPIVLLKAGTGKSGRRAAGSHTGALAEKTDFLGDLCEQYGIVRAATLEEMFEYAQCLASQPLPAGPRLAVITNAGGPAILAADEAERRGLSLPEPSPALRARLAGGLPPAAGLGNPFDILGDAGADRYRTALSAIAAGAEADAIVAICTPQRMTDMAAVARAVAESGTAARGAGKPLAAALARFVAEDDAEAVLDSAGVPNFSFPENAVRALAQAWRHGKWRARSTASSRAEHDVDSARRIVRAAADAGRTTLGPAEAEAVLRAFGIAPAPSVFASSREELAAVGKKLGFPVAAKLVAAGVLHKSDVGGVLTGIADAGALDAAFAALREKASLAGARFQGVVAQKMMEGLEVLIGAHRHAHFGPLIACGLGGVLVEVLGEPRFRRAPLSDWDAEEMLAGMRGAEALGPFRGKPARDRAALRACLRAVSDLMSELPEIAEVDFNPIFATAQGAYVADARLLLGR
jgi:acetyltransferase